MNPLAVFACLNLSGTPHQRRMLVAARRPVSRVSMNGTRGKSTVTRLIHAALVEGHSGKTTGTAARHLLPTEVKTRTPAVPTFHTNRSTLGLAGWPELLVAECMAIAELQWVSCKILSPASG